MLKSIFCTARNGNELHLQFPKFAAGVIAPVVTPVVVIVVTPVLVLVVVIPVVVPVIIPVELPGDCPDDPAHQLLLEPQLGIDQAETKMLLHETAWKQMKSTHQIILL